MTIQIANNALADCHSTEEVVRLMNEDFATDAEPEMIAAKYAYDAADEAGYGIDSTNLEAHLDVLVEAGAKFDYSAALEVALNEKK
jgi:uncharacterized protein YihD (DUF1040 family)